MKKNYVAYWSLFLEQNLDLSNSFKSLFLKMVAFRPEERPSIDDILNDEWMKEINNLNDEQMNFLENEIIAEFKGRKGEI